MLYNAVNGNGPCGLKFCTLHPYLKWLEEVPGIFESRRGWG